MPRRPASASAAPTPIGQVELTPRQKELASQFVVGADNVARYASVGYVPDWVAVKKVFIALGGTWRTGKPGGFHFPANVDARALLNNATRSGAIIDPREAGFFETPRAVADQLCRLARVTYGMAVLEPSAGRGAICEAMARAGVEPRLIFCVEALEAHRAILRAAGYMVISVDFLKMKPAAIPADRFDAIAMNPPFSKGQDIAHVLHAFKFLRPRAWLASVMSAGVEFREDKKTRDFRAFVADNNGTITRLPPGTFKDAGTDVHTVIVTLQRKG